MIIPGIHYCTTIILPAPYSFSVANRNFVAEFFLFYNVKKKNFQTQLPVFIKDRSRNWNGAKTWSNSGAGVEKK